MSSTHHRRLKVIELTFGDNSYECQVESWQIVNNSDDGEQRFAFCPGGEFREESDPDFALELTFYADWRKPDGISHFLWENDGQDVAFQLDHHPDISDEHVRWTGTVKVKAPSVGGEARTEEMTEITLPIVGKPEYDPEPEESS